MEFAVALQLLLSFAMGDLLPLNTKGIAVFYDGTDKD